MKYFIIAGEASGDLHGANLMRGIKASDAQASFRFFGGEEMSAVSDGLIKHYKKMAFMGFKSVLMNLGEIKRNFKLAEAEIQSFDPDVVIFIDYPGFNLRVAKIAKSLGYKTFYYISPKIWAWKEGRVKQIKQHVDKMFTILPFETEFYKKHNYPVTFVGNPTVDELLYQKQWDRTTASFCKDNGLDDRPIIALLAGSRKQEIQRLLPIMAKVSDHFKAFQFVVGGAPSISKELYDQCRDGADITVVYGQTHELLKHAHSAVVASGTAALEAGVIGTPQVVCYKVEWGRFASLLRKLFLKIPYFSLVNLILGREAVKEIFQEKCTVDNVRKELELLIYDKKYRNNIEESYQEMLNMLDGENAGERAAKAIIKNLS
ncbi:lipid-A-disaccharide synthase [Halosquirtibacter xylanolyticus]|uniref:lipid-A-disaccharide synthase n=1 Tax=Halosquirtibacter xylanolyticus TaxID=3374599 RepID=UPI003748B38A|nr:lipid-A-disaccharide synthase [Prolixibacteraceae bacterium]